MSNSSTTDARSLPTDSETVAIPPRYWWLKRIMAASAALIVGLILLRLWWGWEANRRLQAEVDRIVAAGEPIYPEDFDPKEPVPDDQNAAKLLQQAETKLNLTPDESRFVSDDWSDPEAIKANLDSVRKMMETNAESLTLVRRAKELQNIDWGLRIRTPAINTIITPMSGQRQLAKFLSITVTYLIHHGRHDEAIDLLQSIVFQGDAIAVQPSILKNLVGIATVSFAAFRVESISSSLSMMESGGNHPSLGAASREQIKLLMRRLLDPSLPRAARRDAMRGERMLIHDILRSVVDGNMNLAWAFSGMNGPGSWYERAMQWPITPLYTLNARWAVSTSTIFREAAEATTFVSAEAILPEIPEDNDRPLVQGFLQPMGWETFASIHRWFVLHFRHLAMRRMAGIALAIRLYQIDHGRRPEKLGQLAPDYLDVVPDDPFGDGTRPIGYLPDAASPILYSIGDDGVDDGGRFALNDSGGVNMNELDIVFFLDGNRPMPKTEETQPSPTSQSETGEDGDDVKDEGGNSHETQPQQDQPE